MIISQANKELMGILLSQYDEREAENISKVFWEDLFSYKGGIDRHLHTRELVVFRDALAHLKKGWPIQYVTGVSYFYNLKLEVNSSVLIPRPETEELVYQVLSAGIKEGSRILDIGTGSGCIAVALKARRAEAEVLGIDISVDALKLARRNAEKSEIKVDFKAVDFLDEGQWGNLGMFDLVVSNPPYIAKSEQALMSGSTVNHEPKIALYPEGNDVLIFYRKIAAYGQSFLSEGGRIYLECNEFNAAEVADIFGENGFSNIRIIEDMQGKDRILFCTK